VVTTTVEIEEPEEIRVLLCPKCSVRIYVLSGAVPTTCDECHHTLVKGGLPGRIERMP
jgi:hypothetical protein